MNFYKWLESKLPFDTIINHILPYTYELKPKKLLKDIGELIDTKLDNTLKPINEKLDTLEIKIEVVNKKIDKEKLKVYIKV